MRVPQGLSNANRSVGLEGRREMCDMVVDLDALGVGESGGRIHRIH